MVYSLLNDISVISYVVVILGIVLFISYIVSYYSKSILYVYYVLSIIFYIYVGVIVINVWLGGGR